MVLDIIGFFMYICIMECYICKKEADKFSERYVEKVCLLCDARFLEHDIESKKIKKEYRDNHAVCPKCGFDGHSSTLSAFIFDINHPEEYKDLNNCVCSNCGDKHTCHERIPKQK